MSLPKPFPPVDVSADHNPGIRLFGKRFISEQTSLEYVSELLSVVFSRKAIGTSDGIDQPFPPFEKIGEWSRLNARLTYCPPVELNLKLFAFLTCSRLEGRHRVHGEQYELLSKILQERVRSTRLDPRDVVEWVGDLLRGLQGTGLGRAWCAQTFWPVSSRLVTQETIWNESVVKKEPVESWMDSISDFHRYYSVSKHRFLARGGELLYLQLCNAFAADQDLVRSYAAILGDVDEAEIDLKLLYDSLQLGLGHLDWASSSSLDRLIDCIEMLDRSTHDLVQQKLASLECEWCPTDSWREGYLYAVETARLLAAQVDPMEQIELLMTGAVLQVMRSLCSQSARYAGGSFAEREVGVGYAWILTSPIQTAEQQVMLSRHNLQVVQSMIYQALRNAELYENAGLAEPRITRPKLYAEADRRYGHKLFLSLAKALGLVMPLRGPARFVLTDRVLRYMVMVLIRPGDRCTYDEFLERLYRHYGIAVEGTQLARSIGWTGLPSSAHSGLHQSTWIAEMLRAGGFLIELSDACSIVTNRS